MLIALSSGLKQVNNTNYEILIQILYKYNLEKKFIGALVFFIGGRPRYCYCSKSADTHAHAYSCFFEI